MQDKINKAKEVILKGGVILYPTDTIWGIGCSPIIKSAIKKIFKSALNMCKLGIK